ncbi:MAG: hypothetical protein ACKOXO_00455 [Cyanobium sp.]
MALHRRIHPIVVSRSGGRRPPGKSLQRASLIHADLGSQDLLIRLKDPSGALPPLRVSPVSALFA